MKIISLFISLVSFTLSYAQCQYSDVRLNNSTKSLFLKSKPITVDLYETPFNGRLVLATFIRNGDVYYIDFEITRDSSAQDLEPHCFERGDRVSFALSDNSIVTLMQTEDKICGIKLEDKGEEFVTVTDYIRVIVNQDAYEKLSEHEIILMKIKGKTLDKNLVLKSELEEVINDEIYVSNPSRFFMDNIECMVNPKFE